MLFIIQPVFAGPEAALKDYVSTPDPVYGYTHVRSIQGLGYTIHILLMTSQQWRIQDVIMNGTIWTHGLGIIVPDIITTDTGMLIIAGGSNPVGPEFDLEEIEMGVQVAVATGSIVSVVGQVPNQPLYFVDEPYPHTEDELVAYSWDKTMDTGDYTWPVHLPMVKSVVRAMDTVQDFIFRNSVYNVDQFVLAGFSKRGAAAWLTAAVDSRVGAIAPGVIDFLNIAPHIEHHFAAYGFYSSAIQDYVNYNLVRRVRTPEGQALMKIVDPYSYREVLTMPKFLVNSSGDQFFLPDSARFYFDDLQGENLIYYVPNSDHSLSNSPDVFNKAFTSLLSWYINILYDIPRPVIKWSNEAGKLVVNAFPPPQVARLWQTTNSNARDFRLEVIGEAWTSTVLTPTLDGTYVVNIPVPAEGWTAYYVEMIYPGLWEDIPQSYSTKVYINPDVLPFDLAEPIGDPRGIGFWKHQVKVAQKGRGKAHVDPDTLANYFPIPLFERYIKSVSDAEEILLIRKADMNRRALQHCLAVTLNIAHGELGWYSRIRLSSGEGRYLWEHWNDAYEAFLNGRPLLSKEICESINSL
jgi:PhoPQ-activated pathogenicity-related protein